MCDAIYQDFAPAALRREVLNVEHSLFELPAKLGDLAFDNPVKFLSFSFYTSEAATSVLQEALRTGNDIATADHVAHCQTVKKRQLSRRRRLSSNLAPNRLRICLCHSAAHFATS